MALLDEIRKLTEKPELKPEHNAQEKTFAKLATGFVQEMHDILDEQIKESGLDRRETMDIFWAKVRDIQMKSRNRGYNETTKGEELAERPCENEDASGADEDNE